MLQDVIKLVYLLAASLFIVGLKQLSSPATARNGNRLAAAGMLIAVLATLFIHEILTPVEMIGGLVIGGAIGAFLAKWVKMTAMPEMVAAFNAFGGGASTLVALAEISRYDFTNQAIPGDDTITIFLSILIGTVTFSGSVIALGKLSERISGNPVLFPGIRVFTLLLFLGSIAGAVYMYMLRADFVLDPDPLFYTALGVVAVAFVLGIVLVMPIGGADMPVVVALLNSYSGMAAAATGFVLSNDALIISGALVGASGIILTLIMCEAMNRSLTNVLLGGFGGDSGGSGAGPRAGMEGRTVKETSADDAAVLMSYADKVIIVPGYGMAVAQAQHQVRELADLLQSRDVEVAFAIHPVAGRMPGHMNVLLAEANVPYDQLRDMDDVNPEFETTDVVLVIGANDVVNPAAHNDPNSPIYGMPILDVEKARNSIVLKRSMRPGYAGVDNELFYSQKNAMLFGDAKASLTKLIAEVKALQ